MSVALRHYQTDVIARARQRIIDRQEGRRQ
jgi:hypothetical protein